MKHVGGLFGVLVAGALLCGSSTAWAAGAPAESAQMVRAKNLISEDQWVAAIGVLRAAVADPKEPNKDEALFWLAHSQNQAGDMLESVESIRRLQREFAKSRWSAPASSLLIELATKLGRNDVLWWTATPPPRMPPPAVAPRASGPPRMPRPPASTPVAPPPAPPPAPASPPSLPAPPSAAAPPAFPLPPAPPTAWVPEAYLPDTDLRLQALGSLIRTDAPKVIPMLRNIALEPTNLVAARRAVFVLAQSRNPEAHLVVVHVAKTGPEPVRIAAVRELGRFGGAGVSGELLQVYFSANPRIKQQVVLSLGERADSKALLKIAQTETDRGLRERALVALGRAGGREHLRGFYAVAPLDIRPAVITGLFNARDEEGLIAIADREHDGKLRKEVLSCLRLIGTPAAKAYLAKHPK
jgi:hypothetical protein